jgi:ABC-type nitrate/sulfonate/bicarbonate transport system substrate-binding protein
MKFIRTLAFALLILGSVSAQAMAADTTLVRLSYSSGWDALPAIVGVERGFFAEEGIVVSGLAASSAEAVIQSLAVGTTDIALVPQRVMLVMAGAKVPVKVIAMGGWGTEMALVARPDAKIKAAADLKGKTVAVIQGSEALPVLVRILNQAKLKPTDLKILSMNANALLKVLADKKADAVFETRHFTDPIVEQKQGVVVMDPAAVTKTVGVIGGVPLVARNDTIAKEAATTQHFVNAWVKALKYIQQDPVDAARMLQIYFHRQGVVVTEPVAESWVKMTKYDQYNWSKAAIADADYNGWALNAAQILKLTPKLDDYVDNHFADAAVKSLQ